MRNWSQLPADLLHQIMDSLTLPDLIRLGCVCSPWRSASGPARHKARLPWLLLPSENNSEEFGNIWHNSFTFYSLLDANLYKMDTPEINQRRICGSSSNGWLMTIHENSDIHLIHPFTRKIIYLPQLTHFPEISEIHYFDDGIKYRISNSFNLVGHDSVYLASVLVRDSYILKTIVSPVSDHGDNSFVIMGIFGISQRLFFYTTNARDKAWIIIEDDKVSMYCDVTYYKDQFYAVATSGCVVVVEGLDSAKPFTRVIAHGLGEQYSALYLVESAGDLLKVIRFLEVSIYNYGSDSDEEDVEHKKSNRTIRFLVLKLNIEQGKWLEINNIGDRALFVGSIRSYSISTSDFPGCKRNTIYFTDECKGKYIDGSDKGVYSLVDGTIEPLYSDASLLFLPRPIWYAPMPEHF